MILDGYGEVEETRQLVRADLLKDSDDIRKLTCFHLGERFGSHTDLVNPLKSQDTKIVFQDQFSWTSQAMFYGSKLDSGKGEPYYQMVRAGARGHLHFDPHDPHACAAIVSCGGICPGLNSVIREIVMMLWAYGVRQIYGIKGGYKGVVEDDAWITLTPDVVKDIHMQGGTILVSDRGNPPVPEMAKALKMRNVRQYFVLGGDGTHKGAMETFEACLTFEHECAVVGVPKTIDNDVPILDQTFGFDSACTEAVKAVDSAYVEATCNANCIGLVKLMGRHCGFIAMYAVLSARHADICLLPEMEIDVEKVLLHTISLMKTQK
jgi:6-phosphofructokinase 1